MSFVASLLNPYLRLTEKPHMRRAVDPADLRRSFLIKSRIFFHAPFGTSTKKVSLGPGEALSIRPSSVTSDTVLFYIHGGGFIFGAPETHAAMLANLARRTGMRAVLPRYPLAPEAPYPAAPDFVETAYHHLSDQVSPAKIVVGGDSAGGALAFTLLARLLRNNGPLPAALFAFSSLTDLTYSGQSMSDNADADVVLPAERANDMVAMYLGAQDPVNPDVSPLKARFHGAPPVWITAGDTEILRDDSRRMTDLLRAQSVPVRYTEEHNLPHVWPIFHNMLPEARHTLETLSLWIKDQAG